MKAVTRPARKPMMAGNWKMNVNHLEAIALTQKIAFSLSREELDAVDVVLLPPFTDLRSVQTLVDGDNLRFSYGAQDLSSRDNGAFTGDISGSMLAKLGCTYVLVGHSERREHHAEDDAVVRRKVEAAVRHGLAPMLCVGEGLEVRQAGDQVAHCTDQLSAALESLPVTGSWVVAYEPLWAIGTGEVAGPQDAQEVCGALRVRLDELAGPEVAAQVRVLYGGSVKPANIADLLAQPDVDGALIGGASLDADTFAQICRPVRS